MYSYYVEDSFAFADGPIAVAEVYTTAEELVAEVALAGLGRLVHSKVVPDAVLLVVADFAYCPVQQALDNP